MNSFCSQLYSMRWTFSSVDCLLLCVVSLQGIQFYTQIKTVTSQWKAEDATTKSPAVTMPTMGR